ncbi:50S ribosomal protein L35 [candidate division KSB1 bacterium]|nr:MAG: 50S ribosomal protein L35 [candidate division KSB1 bacterium]
MPKIKTYKGAAKRFKYSGGGKLLRTHGGGKNGAGHLRRNRSKRRLRQFGKMSQVTVRGEVKRLKILAPYLDK